MKARSMCEQVGVFLRSLGLALALAALGRLLYGVALLPGSRSLGTRVSRRGAALPRG